MDKIQRLGATTTILDSTEGLERLLAVDVEKWELRLFDGSVQGGYRIPNLTTITAMFAGRGLFAPNANNVLTDGHYLVANGSVNYPDDTATRGTLLVQVGFDASNVIQTWTSSDNEQRYRRSKTGTDWTEWLLEVDAATFDAGLNAAFTSFIAAHPAWADSLKLGGQLPGYYTDIAARLGFTPLNKAGDVSTGAFTLGTLTVTNQATLPANTAIGNVSAAELAYLDGATSNLQSQISALAAIVNQIAKPGMIVEFDLTAAPDGFYVADGSLKNRVTDAPLFAAIGTRHGAGDGVNTFQLPDYRGVFRRGLDSGRGLDPGRTLDSYQGSQNLWHGHGVNDGGHDHLYDSTEHNNTVGWASGHQTTNLPDYDAQYDLNVKATTGSLSNISIQGSGGNEARPVNMATLVCIKR